MGEESCILKLQVYMEILGSSQGSLHSPLNFSVDSKFYNFEIMKVKMLPHLF